MEPGLVTLAKIVGLLLGSISIIPLVFLFDTHDGLITALRVYGDTNLALEVFGPSA